MTDAPSQNTLVAPRNEGAGLRVALLEDEPLFRDMLADVLASEGIEVLTRDAQVEPFLYAVDRAPPDVAIVDLRLERDGDVEAGLAAVRALHARHPAVRLLVLSGVHGPGLEARCLAAGASAYLCKLEVGRDALLQVVRALARGEQQLPPSFGELRQAHAAERARAHPLPHLTPRELEVLRHVALGMDNLKISAHLGITERTVKAHIGALYAKLGVENRAEMALRGAELGLQRGGTQ
ncbi:response regulator transcription factor [Aggregicoccus sp. 17bor-14]|uniref:response regulator transcription factor n=1 Tax=Myxococcaceae TaxID=31 RepID=UPI00129CD32D|nr:MULTISPECIES: response regulator transcription factor [Myxococcaceae]MBF5045503.1 response regulator transcription factor [Simulacricoccus sp. 17bor-14]MRI91240.1 response regulator transcription factor [Aggregicoccus sp. 17bor-14]